MYWSAVTAKFLILLVLSDSPPRVSGQNGGGTSASDRWSRTCPNGYTTVEVFMCTPGAEKYGHIKCKGNQNGKITQFKCDGSDFPVDESTTAGSKACPQGWVELNSCDKTVKAEDNVCVKMGPPIKYISWFHMQYECDVHGGYLLEPTAANQDKVDLLLKSYNQLYGKTKLYLGATDITHENEWKWINSKKDLVDALKAESWENGNAPTKSDNKDCLTINSDSLKWENVDCENDTLEDQVANICMKNKE